jgi:hypothetical protein
MVTLKLTVEMSTPETGGIKAVLEQWRNDGSGYRKDTYNHITPANGTANFALALLELCNSLDEEQKVTE